MNIPFVNLQRQNRIHKKELSSTIEKVVQKAAFILGSELKNFESSFARFCNTKYCLGVNSGTDAIEFALLSLDVGPYDEVITAPNGYFSTAMVIAKTGATPIFADIDPKTHTIDPKQIESKITKHTKAIIPVHLFGQPADMGPIIQLARKYNLYIIEDCCQAHGAKYKGSVVPVSGLGAFSFYPGKNLGAFGDGGALVTNSSRIATRVKRLRNDGSLQKYLHEIIGSKSRLDSLQASILSTKLKHLNRWNRKRRSLANLYSKLLRPIKQIITPSEANYSTHVYHLYVIEATKRNQLQKYLTKHGIATVIHYPRPIHLQPAFQKSGYKRSDFPIAEKKAKNIISLPMFPELKKQEITYVCSKIKKFYS